MSLPDGDRDGRLEPEESNLDNEALVELLVSGHPDAPTALFDAYGAYVERLLMRVLGPDPELEDLLHEVFVEALDSIENLRDPRRLKGWLTRMTVFVARGSIRRRRRHRRLVLVPTEDSLPRSSPPEAHERRELLRRVFRILDELDENQRVAFSLRYIEGMTLGEAANASGVSLATFKRWLQKCDRAFMARAKRTDPELHDTLLATPRWGAADE
jgi:RNA polymerase sigma-70 factor (ECF subfamily)